MEEKKSKLRVDMTKNERRMDNFPIGSIWIKNTSQEYECVYVVSFKDQYGYPLEIIVKSMIDGRIIKFYKTLHGFKRVRDNNNVHREKRKKGK